ncbi:MAG TPA: GNAT family N-acetyltransferase [Solirubrobacterales bacterium]|jgi:RimJ/RimL family protein N-acetyltransferase
MERLPERVEAGELLLRRWAVDDAEGFARLVAASAEHLRPWMPWMAAEPRTLAERIALIRRWEEEWMAGGDVLLAVVRDGDLAGSCGMHRRIGPGGIELGYWIAVPHLRQGVATAVAMGLTNTALSLPGIDRVEIHHDVNNIASAGVPAGLGFEPVGEEPGDASAPAASGVERMWRATAPVGPLRQRA